MTNQPLSENQREINNLGIPINIYLKEDVKQAIQDFLKELKERLISNDGVDDSFFHRTIIRIIDTTFKKHFGDKLL